MYYYSISEVTGVMKREKHFTLDLLPALLPYFPSHLIPDGADSPVRCPVPKRTGAFKAPVSTYPIAS
jgi:hypothetical protein